MIFNKVRELKEAGKIIGITFSQFDMLHAGHIAMLAEAKNHCDYLIAGLQTNANIDRPDTKNKPIQSLEERMIQLSAVKYVDEVVVYSTEQELLDLFRTLPIDVRIIGADYYDKDFTGKQYCLDAGIEIIYNSRNHSYSTTELRKRIAKADKEKTDPEGSV